MATRERRLRVPKSFPAPAVGTTEYARRRPELKSLTPADEVLLVRKTEAWQELMVPLCEELDSKRGRTNPIKYTSEEIELFLMWGRANGCNTYREIREKLDGYKGDQRKILGFDKQRNPNRKMVNRDGIPSRRIVDLHLKRVGAQRREDVLDEITLRLGKEACFGTPEDVEASRILYADGCEIPVHGRCRPSKHTFKNGRPGSNKVTVEGGGINQRGTQGFKSVMIINGAGLPMPGGISVKKISRSEKDELLEIVEGSFTEHSVPHLSDELTVLSADGGFLKQETRAALHQIGIIENLHNVSHSNRKRAADRAKERRPLIDAMRPASKNWFVNGHCELVCKCGQGQVSKVADRAKDGAVTPRVQGSCKNCGRISITAGDWRLTPKGFVPRNRKKDKVADREFLLGNGLTFNDPLAQVYGSRRFAHQEGFHGMLETRFGIGRKGWYRNDHQARAALLSAALVMYAGKLECRRLRDAAAPPPDGA